MDTTLLLIETILKLIPLVAIAAPLIALLIDLGKKIGIVKNDAAGLWSLGLNAAFWVILFIAGQLGIQKETEEFIIGFGQFAPVVVALLIALYGSKKLHQYFVNLGVGYTYTKTVPKLAGVR